MNKQSFSQYLTAMGRWGRVESHAALAFLGFLFIQPVLFPQFEYFRDWWIALGLILIYLPLHYTNVRSRILNIGIVILITSIGVTSLVFNLNAVGSVFFVYAVDCAAKNREPIEVWVATVSIFVALNVSVFLSSFHFVILLIAYIAAVIPMVLVVLRQLRESVQSNVQTIFEVEQEHTRTDAKISEQERISRDLHDFLGQTLTLITLKSELCLKLIDSNPEQAKQEIAEVVNVSRNASKDVRNIVWATRRWYIDEEIESAQNVLEMAGIEFETQIDDISSLNEAAEGAMALAIREGVTNIVKHSRATKVNLNIKTDENSVDLTLVDNGVDTTGNFIGFRGLSERISKVGGELRVKRREDGVSLNVLIKDALS